MPDPWWSRPDSRGFSAAYPGICSECDEPFEPGTMVRYSFGSLVHNDPGECVTIPKKAENICPTCHLTKPCFCD